MRSQCMLFLISIFFMLSACSINPSDKGIDLPGDPPKEADSDYCDVIPNDDGGWEARSIERNIHHPPLPDNASFDGAIRVVFAPDEPLMNSELSLIQEAIDERKADPRSFSREDNPYRILYAVYNLRSQNIVDGLVDARNAGIDVRILVDSEQIDPVNRPWNTAYAYLADQGFVVEENNRLIDRQSREDADVIGISVDGYMHLKLRMFITPSDTRILTGSANAGDGVSLNEDELLHINIPEIAEKYLHAWNSILHGDFFNNRWSWNSPVNILFSQAGNTRPAFRILEWIAEEEEQILLKVFALRDFSAPGISETLVELLARKASEGVPVYVITDRKQSAGPDTPEHFLNFGDPTDEILRRAGVNVYEALNTETPFSAMHHKTAILGKTDIRVITGSANWSISGLGSYYRRPRNTEDVVFIDSGLLDDNFTGRRYLGNWMRVLNRYAYQSVERNGEASYTEVFDYFSGLENWPKESIVFQSTAATMPDEWLFIQGSNDILGNFGITHSGLRMKTSSSDYPNWHSDPLEFNVGEILNWRHQSALPDGSESYPEPCPTREQWIIPDPFAESSTGEWSAKWCAPTSCRSDFNCHSDGICNEGGICEWYIKDVIENQGLNEGHEPENWSSLEISWETAAGGYARMISPDSSLSTSLPPLDGYRKVLLQFEVAKWGAGENGPVTATISNFETSISFDSPVPDNSSYIIAGPFDISGMEGESSLVFSRRDSPSQKRLRNIQIIAFR